MTCKEVMTAFPTCGIPTDTVAVIARLMRIEDVGVMPICEDRKTKKLVGLITDRDLALRVVADGRPTSTMAEEIMTRLLVTCGPNDNLEDAFDDMERFQVRRIPVVGDSGQLVGIISQADVAVRSGQPAKTAEIIREISRPKAA